MLIIRRENKASAKDGEGAGRGPCGLRNSELGPRPHEVLLKNLFTINDFLKKYIDFIHNLKWEGAP